MRVQGRYSNWLWFVLLIVPFQVQAEIISTLDDQKSVSLTIYNQNLALIRDVRTVSVEQGLNTIAIREVSGQIRPETTILTSLSHANNLQLLEQNFDFDLLTPQQLLQKYVGRQVRLIQTHPSTGEETLIDAKVLSAQNGVVLQIGDRIETGVPGRLVFDQVPDNLRDRPTLSLLTRASEALEQDVSLSYLSSGFDWKADYVAKLDEDEKHLDLNGWVTINNQSGASYQNATLQLVAGDVNQVQDERLVRRMLKEEMIQSAAASDQFQQESLFEYHLYSLPRQTDILQNQTKQIGLFNATSVPVQKEYLLSGQRHYYFDQLGTIGESLKVGVYVEFENEIKSGLGKPIPKGIVRVYKDDSQGTLQFIGEDQVDHTPEGEAIRLKLGDAFDVTANKKQLSFNKESAWGKYRHASRSAYEIELHNAKDEDVTVTVIEPVPGEWEVTGSSHEHEKVSSNQLQWKVKVAAKQTTTLNYEVIVRY